MATDPTLPVPLIAGGAAAVIAVFNRIAAVPTRSAKRLSVAGTLRSE